LTEGFVSNTIAAQATDMSRCAIDIGANHGHYTVPLASKFKTVYAFEPEPENLAVLRRSVGHTGRRNGAELKNVVVEDAAIGLEDGTTKLYINDNPGGHSISQRLAEEKTWGHATDRFIEVRSVRLDTYFRDIDVGFIKCDIEGGESFIFEGGVEMLRRCSPKIMLEVHQAVDYPRLYKFFDELGYGFTNEKGQRELALQPDTHYLIER
jgi:FkbM family methyltransferase